MNVHALIIGNNNYEQATKLVNAINDAQGVEQMFKKLGYSTTLINDFKKEDIAGILSDLEDRLKTNIDVTIFYFAGHAFEVDNNNHIAPVDCPLAGLDRSNCTHYSLKLKEIIDIFDKSKCSVKIIILDACRNNPFEGDDRGEGIINLAPINVTKGYIIAYSTSPGRTASDSPKRQNSIYTEEFHSHFNEKHKTIESFCKKVRETVYTLSGGRQVPWEHTSLIGQFCFNQGQIGYREYPYDEEAIKDYKYISRGTEADGIIHELRSCNYYKQNSAIYKFQSLIDPGTTDKNQQFVIGRNILQSCEKAFDVGSYVDNLVKNLLKYQTADGENHILNGMLFEIYFDSHGQFRSERFKVHKLDKIFALQYDPRFIKSFQFICDLLVPYQDFLYYMPNCSRRKVSVTVHFEQKEGDDYFGNPQTYNIIDKIAIGAKDITNVIKHRFYIQNATKDVLTNAIASHIAALSNDIQYNPDIPDDNLYVNK
ncbi:caspase family protein [Alistipes ihumii]